MKSLIKTCCLIMFFTANKSFAQTCKAYDIENGQNQSLLEYNDFNQLKKDQIQYQRNNQAGFCERNLKIRFLKANKLIQPEQCLSMTNMDLESLVVVNKDKDKSIWSFSIMPKFEYKQFAFNSGFQIIENFETFDLYPKYQTKEFKKAYFHHILPRPQHRLLT